MDGWIGFRKLMKSQKLCEKCPPAPTLGKDSIELTDFPKLKYSGAPPPPPKKDKRTPTKEHRKILRGGEYVCHLDCSDGITSVNIVSKVMKLCTKYMEYFYI